MTEERQRRATATGGGEPGSSAGAEAAPSPPLDARHAQALRARAATGLRQADFARLLGVHSTTVWSWEHGVRHPARRMRVLLRLVEALPEQCLAVLRDEPGPVAQAPPAPPMPPAQGSSGHDPPEDAERAVLRVLAEEGRGDLGTVPLDRLRPALGDLPRARLDATLLELERRGLIALRPALFPARLSAAEREAALLDEGRGALLFVDGVDCDRSSALEDGA